MASKNEKPKRLRETPRSGEPTGKRGYPRAYSEEEFRRAVRKYFASISYEDVAKDLEGEPILSCSGKPIKLVRYAVPPSKQALCLYLGISRDTYSEYSHRKGYSAVCDEVSTRVEAYLATELDERENRGRRVDGIKFNLANNYGWRERREVELGEETRREASAAALTLAERRELLRSAAAEFGELGETEAK